MWASEITRALMASIMAGCSRSAEWRSDAGPAGKGFLSGWLRVRWTRRVRWSVVGGQLSGLRGATPLIRETAKVRTCSVRWSKAVTVPPPTRMGSMICSVVEPSASA